LIRTYSEVTLDSISAVARDIVSYCDEYKVFLLVGEMGVGKTTLVQAVCKEMGVQQEVSSPTFSIINEIETPADGIVYHMDLYRIKEEQELSDIGIDEYLYSGNICFIEWPDLLVNRIGFSFIALKLRRQGDSGTITIMINE
jgi:tRNA threonylcarbamoyladenosine biosynthesis protein TsaE